MLNAVIHIPLVNFDSALPDQQVKNLRALNEIIFKQSAAFPSCLEISLRWRGIKSTGPQQRPERCCSTGYAFKLLKGPSHQGPDSDNKKRSLINLSQCFHLSLIPSHLVKKVDGTNANLLATAFYDKIRRFYLLPKVHKPQDKWSNPSWGASVTGWQSSLTFI